MIRLVFSLMFVTCITLATVFDTRIQALHNKNNASGGVITALLGDSRRMFGNQFAAMADAYFHSGFYPTIFDAQGTEGEAHVNGGDHDEHHDEKAGDHHEEESSFLGKPKDWVEDFGRHFFPHVHTHLEDGKEREILPWLQLSAEMDPQRIQTYLTAAYWLRTSIKKPDEAERFLRQGLKANPDSFEILMELGRVDEFNKKDARVARNVYELAAQKWKKQETAGLKPEPREYGEILGGSIRCDTQLNDLPQLIIDLEALKAISPNKDSIQQTIDETKAKLTALPH